MTGERYRDYLTESIKIGAQMMNDMMHKKSYLIDELQSALRIMGVDAATVDRDSVKEDFE